MSRYNEVDNIDFTTINGNTFQIKEMREIPDYDTLANYDFQKEDEIDEVISKVEFYGDGAEDLTYAAVEHNNVKLDENDYNTDNLKTLLIPSVET